jgi:hypothetical protein
MNIQKLSHVINKIPGFNIKNFIHKRRLIIKLSIYVKNVLGFLNALKKPENINPNKPKIRLVT